MSINWNNIRPLNNSLNDGFEELVCQLASKEKIKNSTLFRRIGKPDGGKECYWVTNDGSLHMWQAKYFTTSLTNTQWQQITKSVKSAIDNYSELQCYYVCLPLDMPDAKVPGKTSMLEKWIAQVKVWKDYAASKKCIVEFDYWGSSELIRRLSLKDNQGLQYYWFNKEEFSDEWFDYKNNECITALGVRYTNDLNIELPIAKVFDGLARNSGFESEVNKYYSTLLEKYRRIRISEKEETLRTDIDNLANTISQLRRTYEKLAFTSNQKIPIEALNKILDQCIQLTADLQNEIYNLGIARKKEKEADPGFHYDSPYSSERSDLYSFSTAVNNFKRYLNGSSCRLANSPFLLVTGDAGMGKSHLLADIVVNRRKERAHSLFFLGENFTTMDLPWTQLLHNQLRKQIDEFVFLGALNAKAESEGRRLIIFIDALNEGNGRIIWPRRLRSFGDVIASYAWLGLVVSIRSSFVRLIAPEDEIKNDLFSIITHTGFLGNEYVAVKKFFEYYKIVQPDSPLLNPEFQNPLFLKLFCKSLAERKLNRVPPGFGGISIIIDYFIETINLKLSRPAELHFDEKIPLLKNAIEQIILKMVENAKEFLTYRETNEIVSSLFDRYCSNKEPYLKRLISEGVFNEDIYWNEDGSHTDVIYFAYQRFQDHLMVSILLDKYFDNDHPEENFTAGRLHQFIKDARSARGNQNIVEALSIQLPERFQKELHEIAPHANKYLSVAEGFIQSLIWRQNDAIGEVAKKYVNEVIITDQALFNKFLDVCILASMKPEFYFNAERLHTFFMRFSMSERDAFWTTWLQDKYVIEGEEVTSVKRLIDYGWNNEQHSHLDDKSIFLGSITLSWFFTSSNRYLRDAATKALVNLLRQRPHLIPQLLAKFEGVNDPYVLERIYAASYGAVLHTENHKPFIEISEYIYKEIFSKNKVYPHILLRDYARQIIEYTIHLGYYPAVKVKKIRPPYKSKPLPKRLPSTNSIDKKYDPKGKDGNYEKKGWGATAILRSMATEYGRGTAGYGDFGRYTFQRALSKWKVNYDKLSNYAIQLIFKMGYDPQIFTEFDSKQGSGRSAGHKERIGKKYQWIAFYEILARTADHYTLIDESTFGRDRKAISYNGPWYPFVRNIDPSLLIRKTKEERYEDKHSSHWWFKTAYQPWDEATPEWIVNKKDLPRPEKILEVTDYKDQSWLWLEIHPEWGEPEPLGEDRWDTRTKRLWYQLRSYLVRKKDIQKLKDLHSKMVYRGELPEARSIHSIFDREYYWSSPFQFFSRSYYHGGDWISVPRRSAKTCKVHRTCEYFNWEAEYDCSKETAVQFYKPVKWILESLNLKQSEKEGVFIDEAGEVVCFDPAVHVQSISGLLIRKDVLVKWLQANDLVLVWSLVGEKQFLGNIQERLTHPTRLNISGLYLMEKESITGELKFSKE